MAGRWTTFALVMALVALNGGDLTSRTSNGIMAEADCLRDGVPCGALQNCPALCCSGMAMRSSGGVRFCPEISAVFGRTTDAPPVLTRTPSITEAPTNTDPVASSAASNSNETPFPTEGDATNTNTNTNAPPSAQSQATDPAPTTTTAPAPTPAFKKTDSVDAFQSTTTLASSRNGINGSTMIVVIVGALAGCVVLVAAVMHKRKSTGNQPLEIPGSSYVGSDGAGLTPDNRSLDGMMDGGVRATSDSMKQLPVLSMGNRQDANLAARVSSPFGQGSVRISSPANRGGSNEDYAFEVDTSSRAGSNVQVAFVDTNHDMELVAEANGVVAL